MAASSFGTMILQVTSGADAGRKVEIAEGQRLQVGRGADSDIAISNDASISRLHFTVQHAGAAVILRDLGSRNGTLVNGTRVSTRQLADGDTILAGDTSFGVRLLRQVTRAAPRVQVRAQPEATSPVPPRSTLASAREIERDYDSALADEDVRVRQEALIAAAWTRQPWLLDHCRRLAASPSPEHWPELWVLSVLGAPEDLPLIQKAAEEPSLGARRLALVGSYGHPDLVDLLLREMDAKDPMIANAAGLAFAHITGCEVWSDRTGVAAPTDASESDGFEGEFLEEMTLPNRQRALEQWQQMREEFARHSHWCRGMKVSSMLADTTLEEFDLEARYEVEMRLRWCRNG